MALKRRQGTRQEKDIHETKIRNREITMKRIKQKTQGSVSEEEKSGLKKRATFTAILLCIVFSYLYVKQVF